MQLWTYVQQEKNLIIEIFLWCWKLKLIMFNLMEIFIPMEFVY